MVDPTEQSPEQQLPFHADVNKLSAGALAYVSWQFSELHTQYSQHDETDSSQLLVARDNFLADMQRLGERNPVKAAAVYEGLSTISDPVYRKHAVDCIEAYAAVRPSRAYEYMERLINDPEPGIRTHMRSRLELLFRPKDEAHAATWLSSFGLTWLQGTRLLIESHKVERRIASEAARKVGETVLTEIVERHRLRSDDHD